jgi:hypothetical protein
MHRNNVLFRSLVASSLLSLVLSAAAFAAVSADDRSDAWVSVSQMIKFIEMGDKSSTERAGNDAVALLEKAIEKEADSSKKDKLTDAKAKVGEALGYAGRAEWPYAESAAKRALELIDNAK